MDRRVFLEAGGMGALGCFLPGMSRAEGRAGGSAGSIRPELMAEGRTSGSAGSPQACAEEKEILGRVEGVVSSGPFSSDWDSLKGYRVPSWYEDSKFGIFIHWGVYSVPAFMSEWYPREMYFRTNPCFWRHALKYGPQSKFGYKEFIPMFKAEKFDPDSWADLFKRAGARYVVPVAEHHDGFQMYDSKLSEWCAAKMGPRRDLIGELAFAVRKAGMVFGLSSHRAEHWWFFEGGRRFRSDVREGKWDSLYGPAQPEKKSRPDKAFMDNWLARCVELCDKYQPQLFWFDWWIEQPEFEPYRQKFAAYYYNRGAEWNKGVALNYKNQAFPDGAAVLDLERSALGEIRPLLWQTDTSVSYISWGYIQNDKFKKPAKLIKELADIVSKNGVLLLNVGPQPDGAIPEQAQSTLLEIGKWLAVNGEAIYGTRPWKVFGEGPTSLGRNTKYGAGEILAPELTARDVRFTRKGDTLYAMVMGWPEDGKVEIKSLGKNAGLLDFEIASVRLLGAGAKIKFASRDDALIVTLPDEKFSQPALALAISGPSR